MTTAAHQQVLAERDAARAELAQVHKSVAAHEQTRAKLEAGWALVPVVVASVDIAENTVVTTEMIAQRSVPKQFVTSSVVKPDSVAYVVNQKVLVPLQAGDLPRRRGPSRTGSTAGRPCRRARGDEGRADE